MLRFASAIALLVIAVVATPVRAGLRCEHKLVDEGDSAAELLLACGEPLLRQVVAVENTSKSEGIVEQWTYSFGPGTLLQIVTLEAGRIVRIEDGDRQ